MVVETKKAPLVGNVDRVFAGCTCSLPSLRFTDTLTRISIVTSLIDGSHQPQCSSEAVFFCAFQSMMEPSFPHFCSSTATDFVLLRKSCTDNLQTRPQSFPSLILHSWLTSHVRRLLVPHSSGLRTVRQFTSLDHAHARPLTTEEAASYVQIATSIWRARHCQRTSIHSKR